MILRRLTIIITFLTAWVWSNGQQINAVPDYVFRNQMSVGRNAVTDTAAYFSIGPRYGANKGFMPPIVGDTATFSSGKRNGLLIFSVQKNKFLYWDSVRVQWSDMAGSSGSYITGSGITGYLPQFSASTTLDTSALFTLGNRLGIGSSTFAYNSTNTANVELNGTAGGILGFKRNDSARGYLWHTGDNMELANTAAGSIFFNTNSATRGSISSAGVWRLHNLAGTGDRVVVASSNGTLSAASSATALVDTTTISTRAWRQKGLDSLAALEVSGSGTTNYIPKFTAGSTIGNSQIFDNGTNVGVGTASPNASMRLHVLGQTRIDVDSGQAMLTGVVPAFGQVFTQTIDKNGDTRIGTNRHLIFRTSDVSERLRITSGGDVGIGTSSPTGTANRFVNIYGTASNELHLTNATTGTTSTDGFTILQSGNDIYQYNYEAGFLEFGTSNASRFRIFANGRVGINTTTDAGYQLDVSGTLRSVNGANFATTSGNVGIGTAVANSKLHLSVSSASDDGIIINNGTNSALIYRANTSYSYGGVSGNSLLIYQPTNNLSLFSDGGAITFHNGGTPAERARFNTSGELLINTTSDAGDYKLQVAGNIYTTGNIQMTGSTAIRNSVSQFIDYGTGGSGDLYIRGGSGFSNVLTATNAGDVGIGTSSPTQALSIVRGAGLIGGISLRGNNNDAANEFFVGQGSAGNAFLAQRANADLSFSTNNTTRLYIFANGRIGINTTTDAGYQLDVNGTLRSVNGANFATTSGNVGIGTASPLAVTNYTGLTLAGTNGTFTSLYTGASQIARIEVNTTSDFTIKSIANVPLIFGTNNTENARFNTGGELLINTTTDAGDYKLQVSGNALVTAGKLDITTNTAFGLSVTRSGTSVVAGQINNSNGILYYGAESSTGGGLFTGSSAYAAVIGSGAAYPLQFATDNVTRATINTNGELLINTLTDNGDFKLQVNGSALISGSIQTANPVSGTAVPWRLGSVVATNVQLDTGNYVEVNINGTFYRLAIVTPL